MLKTMEKLVGKLTDQSKIRWAISIFIPFKSVGSDGIVLALYQQEVNHLTTHQCCIFKACLGRIIYPKLGGRSR